MTAGGCWAVIEELKERGPADFPVGHARNGGLRGTWRTGWRSWRDGRIVEHAPAEELFFAQTQEPAVSGFSCRAILRY